MQMRHSIIPSGFVRAYPSSLNEPLRLSAIKRGVSKCRFNKIICSE